MAADPRQRPSQPGGGRRLRIEEAGFYASVYGSARKGCLNDLRRQGCSEEEAEEIFSGAFEKVMETVDPIERKFSAAQMVSFLKRTCSYRLIDERRRRGLRSETELSAVQSLSDASAQSPDEVAVEREAVAIGHEALQTLSERDRLIFRQRHQMNLSPEEILQNVPGLSLRTYRKIMQRANARVLEAFERIEAGERCEEMESRLLRRYIAGQSTGPEQRSVKAHLAHCRACQQAQAQMRGYLFDVASGHLVVASSLAGADRSGALGNVTARLLELGSEGARALGEASRALRERLREALLRLPGALPGSDGGATVGPALGVSSVKIASVCAAGIAAGACVATGLVPGLGAVAILGHDQGGGQPAGRTAKGASLSLTQQGASAGWAVPEVVSPTPKSKANPSDSKRAKKASRQASDTSASTGKTTSPASSSPSSAKVSDSLTGTEFGAESEQPAPTPAPSTSGSAGVESKPAKPIQSGSGSASEFGM